MRTITTLAISATFLAGFAFAQQPDERRQGQGQSTTQGQSSSSTASSSSGQEKTVTGCLSKGGDSANMYVLTEKDGGNKWHLSESATANIDFTKHVNHEVRVKGREMAASGSGSSSSSTSSTSSTSTTQSQSGQSRPGTSSSTTSSDGRSGHEKQLQVTSIEHVASTCEAKSR
jgi:hypothetical protein